MQNFIKSILSFFFISILIISCNKEINYDLGAPLSGSIVANSSGECFPSIVYGTYIENVALNPDSNYIELTADVTDPGAWAIKTDTFNGMYFSGSGSVSKAGKAILKLEGKGTPFLASLSNDAHIINLGATSCEIKVKVLPNFPKSFYSLLGSPNQCSGGITQGIYKAGVALNPVSNQVKITVFVSSPGLYTFGPVVVNGMVFQASNLFTGTNNQEMIIEGAGTPITEGTFNLNVSTGPAICTVPITVTQ